MPTNILEEMAASIFRVEEMFNVPEDFLAGDSSSPS
jgi:hypothetical protein